MELDDSYRMNSIRFILKCSVDLEFHRGGYYACYYFHIYCNYITDDTAKLENQVSFLSSFLFLAGKAAEEPRRIRDVMNVVKFHSGQEVIRMDFDEAYMSEKSFIFEKEQMILRVLRFETQYSFPHLGLLKSARQLNLTEDVVKVALICLNDCLTSPSITNRSMDAVSISCIILSLYMKRTRETENSNVELVIQEIQDQIVMDVTKQQIEIELEWISKIHFQSISLHDKSR